MTARPGRGRRLAWGLLFTALFVASHARLFLLAEQTFVHDTRHWFPIFAYMADGVRQGEMPYWSPYVNTGEPFYFLPTPFRFYDPGTLLTMWAGGKMGVSPLTLYAWDYLRRFVVLALGAALLSSLFSKHPRTPLFVYVAVLFSSIPTASFYQHGLVYDAYTVPFVLFFFHRLADRGFAWRDLFLFAYFLGTGVANYKFPYAFWYLTVYGILHFTCGEGRLLRGRLLTPRNAAAAALVIAVVLCCTGYLADLYFQRDDIVPTLRQASGSQTTRDVRVEFGSGSHASLIDLASLLCPAWGLLFHYFGSSHFVSEAVYYAGIIPVFLAGLAVFQVRRRVKWVWLFLLVLLASMIHGSRSPVSYLSHHFFPSFTLLRHMEFWQPFVILTLVWLAGLGADLVFRLVRARRWRERGLLVRPAGYAILGYAIGIHLLIAGYLKIARDSGIVGGPKLYLMGVDFYWLAWVCTGTLAGCFAILVLVVRRRLSERGFVVGGALLLLFDMMTFQRVLAEYTLGPRASREVAWSHDFPFHTRRLEMPERYRGEDEGRIQEDEYCYWPLVERRSYAWSHDRKGYVEMKSFSRLHREIASETVRLDLFAVTTPVLRFVGSVAESGRDAYRGALAGPDGEALSRGVTVHDLDAGSRVRWAGVIRSGEGRPGGLPEGIPLAPVSFSADKVVVESDAPSDGFLYYADAWHPGWSVRVDGAPAPLVRANDAYKGVFLPAGRHQVTFRFDPLLFRRGLWVLYAMHGIAFALLVSGWFRALRGRQNPVELPAASR